MRSPTVCSPATGLWHCPRALAEEVARTCTRTHRHGQELAAFRDALIQHRGSGSLTESSCDTEPYGQPSKHTWRSTVIKEKKTKNNETMTEPRFRLRRRRQQMDSSRHCARTADIPTQMQKGNVENGISGGIVVLFCHFLWLFAGILHTRGAKWRFAD